MRTLTVLAALVVVLVGGLVAFLLWGGDDARHTGPVPPQPKRETVELSPEAAKGPVRLPPRVLLPEKTPQEQRDDAITEENENNIQYFGQEFEKRWRTDRERLGQARHADMEKLWFDGRRPRGEEKSIDKLEELLRDFPDSNRAGCAAYELGHHYMRARNLSIVDRRKKAETYWRLTQDRYAESLCEYNEPAAAASKLALAQWIYRTTDPAQARRLLQEIIEQHKGETDHLGQSLADVAQRILEGMK